MAKSGETSPVDLSSESRTSSFSRKRTNSHLTTSSRTKTPKRENNTSNENSPQTAAPDFVRLDSSSAEENETTDEKVGGTSGVIDISEVQEDDHSIESIDDDSEPQEVVPGGGNRKVGHGTIAELNSKGQTEDPHSTHLDAEMSGDDSSTSSQSSGKSDDIDHPQKVGRSKGNEVKGNILPGQKTKKELRRERRAARKQIKLQRAQQALKRGKTIRFNGGMLDLPKGGNGFIGLEEDDGEEDKMAQENEPEEGEEEDEEDDDSGLLVGSRGISPSPPPLTRQPNNGISMNSDFVSIDISSDSESDDKDTQTQRLQTKRGNEKLPQSISGRNALSEHKVIEIISDVESSFESGEEISANAQGFPPSMEVIPRLRLLMQYYTPISQPSFPHEEDRDLFASVKTDEFCIPSPKRRKVEDDSALREFFGRQICGVCASEGHEEKECQMLRCQHCLAWDRHFSHACPHKPPRSAVSDSSDEGVFNWRRVPPVNYPQPVNKCHPTALNMGCYSCASDHHFGDDCEISGLRGLRRKGPWSMNWAKEQGWIDESAPPAKAAIRVREREREREREVGSYGQSQNQGPGRDSRRDRDARRDRDRDRRDRDWDNGSARDGGGGYRSRYGGSEREASPPRSSGGYGRDRERSRDRNRDRRRSPPPPPPPRSMLPPLPREPLPPPVGYTGNGGGGRKGGKGGSRGGVGLEERIKMMPSSGKKEWAKFKR